MNFHSMKLELLLHSLVFKLMASEDEEEREFLTEIWESAMEARQEIMEDIKRIDEENKQGRFVFKPKKLTDSEKAERRRERIERNSKWN